MPLNSTHYKIWLHPRNFAIFNSNTQYNDIVKFAIEPCDISSILANG